MPPVAVVVMPAKVAVMMPAVAMPAVIAPGIVLSVVTAVLASVVLGRLMLTVMLDVFAMFARRMGNARHIVVPPYLVVLLGVLFYLVMALVMPITMAGGRGGQCRAKSKNKSQTADG